MHCAVSTTQCNSPDHHPSTTLTSVCAFQHTLCIHYSVVRTKLMPSYFWAFLMLFLMFIVHARACISFELRLEWQRVFVLFYFYSYAHRIGLHMTHILPSLFVRPICPLFKLKCNFHRKRQRASARVQLKPFVHQLRFIFFIFSDMHTVLIHTIVLYFMHSLIFGLCKREKTLWFFRFMSFAFVCFLSHPSRTYAMFMLGP